VERATAEAVATECALAEQGNAGSPAMTDDEANAFVEEEGRTIYRAP
jgi:hypothetical protein